MLSIKSPAQIAVLLALASLVVLLLLTAPDKDPELQQVMVPGVRVAAVGLHDLVPAEVVSGRLDPARRAAMHFELSGQIESRPVEPGQRVRQDELLLSLASGDYGDALIEAEARLAQESRDIERDRELLTLSKRNYGLQQNDLERLDKLGAESLVSQSLLDEARIKLLQLQAEVARLKSSVASAESRIALKQAERNRAARNLARTQLLAPFAGSVNAVEGQIGDYVTPGDMIAELIDTSSLDLYVEVRGNVAQSLAQGDTVDVVVDGATLPGKVIAFQIDPDPVTFTHALRVRVAGASVRPGQVAQVRLPLRELNKVTAVPVTAVLYDEGQTFVFRLDGDTLVMSAVTLGERVGDLQVVQRGVDASDRIVTHNVSALSDGQKVRVIASEPVTE
ncbi:MAG: efflux RND transporter periplasmic adaptor subunit [Gammaproteobacteria bacterium]|nr:efflux RND transporter periplasmic adaptor subunit [Gammaproteobacteria bacterium]MDH3984848.1 efflux RND transporter periplasmic adaptor subunit [Gammaproteobacteria bacterium]